MANAFGCGNSSASSGSLLRRTNGRRWAIVSVALSLLVLLRLRLRLLGADTTGHESNHDNSDHGHAANKDFVLVTDAGSSGTRFYLFPRDIAGPGDLPTSSFLKLEGEALQDQTPETVFGYVEPGLLGALERVPAGASIEWHVYATAGMRLVPKSLQKTLYAAMREGAASLGGGNKRVRVFVGETRTLGGDEEGYFAALAVNYLAGKLTRDLRPVVAEPGAENEKKWNTTNTNGMLYGAMDLGGSSTQVSYVRDKNNSNDPSSNLRSNNRDHPPPLSPEDFFVHSYPNYGANRMRETLLERWAEQFPTNSGVALTHPCLFRGDTATIDGRVWEGAGNATACIEFIESVVAGGNRDCPTPHECALDSVPQPPPVPGTRFYAVSVYYYAVRFAHDATSHYHNDDASSSKTTPEPLGLPNPKLRDLEVATEWICGLEADKVHLSPVPLSSDTPPEQVYRRCFDLAYIVVLMRRFSAAAVPKKETEIDEGDGVDDIDNVYFVNRIHGHKINWTLGAYLTLLARDGETETRGSDGESPVRPIPCCLAAWMGGFAMVALLVVVVGLRYRHTVWARFRSLRSPKDAND